VLSQPSDVVSDDPEIGKKTRGEGKGGHFRNETLLQDCFQTCGAMTSTKKYNLNTLNLHDYPFHISNTKQDQSKQRRRILLNEHYT
jgi:hypothetical protein